MKLFQPLLLSTILLALLMMGSTTSAQKIQAEGYIIKDGARIEGEIDYDYWNSNPTGISFSEGGKRPDVYKPSEISEFGIELGDNLLIYRSFELHLDLSNNNLDLLYERNEKGYVDTTLFLSLLLDGGVLDLYRHTDDKNVIRYFLKKEGREIDELIYKKMKILDYHTTWVPLNQYKSQVSNLIEDCDQGLMGKFPRLRYTRTDLTAITVQYNECMGSEVTYIQKQQGLRLKVRTNAGVHLATFNHKEDKVTNFHLLDFPAQLSPFIGITLELNLSRVEDKFSVLLDANYHNLQIDEQVVYDQQFNPQTLSADYDLGILRAALLAKYKLSGNENSGFYLEGGISYNIYSKDEVSVVRVIETGGTVVHLQNYEDLVGSIGFMGGMEYRVGNISISILAEYQPQWTDAYEGGVRMVRFSLGAGYNFKL